VTGSKLYLFYRLSKLVNDNLGLLFRSRNFGCLTHLLVFMSRCSSAGTILPTGTVSHHLVVHYYCAFYPWRMQCVPALNNQKSSPHNEQSINSPGSVSHIHNFV
jgi:hypothetical protein